MADDARHAVVESLKFTAREVSNNLRQDIAGAIYDATGLHGDTWATVSDVASEHALADAVMAVVEPLADENTRLVAELDKTREVLGRTAEVTAERDQARASVEHLRGDFAKVRTERDSLLVELESSQDREKALEESRFRWAEEAAQRETERDGMTRLAADANEQLAAVRAAAGLLPEDWRKRLADDYPDQVIDLIETPAIKLMREGIERSQADRRRQCRWWSASGRQCTEWNSADSDYCEHHTTMRIAVTGTRFARWESYDWNRVDDHQER